MRGRPAGGLSRPHRLRAFLGRTLLGPAMRIEAAIHGAGLGYPGYDAVNTP